MIASQDLLADADWLDQLLGSLPSIEGPDYAASRARYIAALDNLVDGMKGRQHLPRVKVRWAGASCAWHGLRATSTSGAAGAMRNWIKQARAKAQGAAQ